jgi:hypothetical protein
MLDREMSDIADLLRSNRREAVAAAHNARRHGVRAVLTALVNASWIATYQDARAFSAVFGRVLI